VRVVVAAQEPDRNCVPVGARRHIGEPAVVEDDLAVLLPPWAIRPQSEVTELHEGGAPLSLSNTKGASNELEVSVAVAK
jgi:hypothetical protein